VKPKTHKFDANRKNEKEDMQEQPRHQQGEDPASVKTVLIVEDDADIGEDLTAFLQDATPRPG
jgi:hypothetical protein